MRSGSHPGTQIIIQIMTSTKNLPRDDLTHTEQGCFRDAALLHHQICFFTIFNVNMNLLFNNF
ncbi:hypothetical protein SAMN05428975_1684 [Mucilaginibacter sp. OK268]|nr:hypothetical protein SAMN05428975_1684 [Mucilaginibacter sp. OK268]